jgi:hypothetical protein
MEVSSGSIFNRPYGTPVLLGAACPAMESLG